MKYITSFFVIVVVAWASTHNVFAQAVPSATSIELPTQLTRASVNEILGQLSDKEVRDVLKKQLVALADKQEKSKKNQQSTAKFFNSAFKAVGNSISQATAGLPQIGASLSIAWKNFVEERSVYRYFFVSVQIQFGDTDWLSGSNDIRLFHSVIQDSNSKC